MRKCSAAAIAVDTLKERVSSLVKGKSRVSVVGQEKKQGLYAKIAAVQKTEENSEQSEVSAISVYVQLCS